MFDDSTILRVAHDIVHDAMHDRRAMKVTDRMIADFAWEFTLPLYASSGTDEDEEDNETAAAEWLLEHQCEARALFYSIVILRTALEDERGGWPLSAAMREATEEARINACWAL